MPTKSCYPKNSTEIHSNALESIKVMSSHSKYEKRFCMTAQLNKNIGLNQVKLNFLEMVIGENKKLKTLLWKLTIFVQTAVLSLLHVSVSVHQEVLMRVVGKEGFFSLWKGFTPYYARLGPHTVLTFIFLEQMNRLYKSYVLDR